MKHTGPSSTPNPLSFPMSLGAISIIGKAMEDFVSISSTVFAQMLSCF